MSMRLILVLLLLTSTGAQGDTEDERATLRGLDGVYVLVERLEPDVERDGLTKQQIRTDVELQLRKAGIRVLTREESSNAPGSPVLYVQVSTSQQPNGFYAVVIRTELYQNTSLVRNPDIVVLAMTWSSVGTVGTVGRAHVRTLRASVADMVDQFMNAYLAVNPEQAGRAPPPSQSSPPPKRR